MMTVDLLKEHGLDITLPSRAINQSDLKCPETTF